jgi:O-6-methylguanine DNA methyltransferase
VFLAATKRESLLAAVERQFPGCRADDGPCRDAVLFLRRYFEQGAVAAAPRQLDPGPATAFQCAVWDEAALIAFGQVRTYAWIAARVGRPAAARAVGNALGRNPLPIIVPCHRVVCGSGSLGGFSAEGGMALKRRLLEHEGVLKPGEKQVQRLKLEC